MKKGMTDTNPMFWFGWITSLQVCLHSLSQTKKLYGGATTLPHVDMLESMLCTLKNTETNDLLSALFALMDPTLLKNL